MNSIDKLFTEISNQELTNAILEIQEDQQLINGGFRTGGVVRKYANELSKINGLSNSENLDDCSRNLIKTAAFRWAQGGLQCMPDVNRVEVIEPTGRAYSNWRAKGICTSIQDSGKTLKVFIQ